MIAKYHCEYNGKDVV